MKVELCCAALPAPLRVLAVHCWLVVHDGPTCQRWEVWQTRNAGGCSIGHVHRDLKAPYDGVGGGRARIAAAWTGEQAGAISRVLDRARDYPHCERYLAWPGPNSNTFVAWVLREAGIVHPLGRKAFGRSYPVR